MNLKVQRKLAAQVLKCSQKRVVFSAENLPEIKEAITKKDMRLLASDGLVFEEQKRGVSRVRARKILKQKRKGLRKGPGKRKGKANARSPLKKEWINKIRYQREYLQLLKEKKLIESKVFVQLYRKAKGGFFRSKRHIKIYMEEKGLFK